MKKALLVIGFSHIYTDRRKTRLKIKDEKSGDYQKDKETNTK